MKKIIKKFIPSFLLSWYHKVLALFAMIIYGFPSNKLIVVGVTGTNGKSTTVNLIGKILEEASSPEFGEFRRVGWITTANFKIAGKEWLNDKKMTMLGRLQTQRLLKQMVKAGCSYAIIETSSEGIKQYRHLGINYDIAVFTNLTPEHIESHGSFENYKRAKGELFNHLSKKARKPSFALRATEDRPSFALRATEDRPSFALRATEDNKTIPKVIIVNADDEHADYFLNFPADKKITFSIKQKSDIQATDIQIKPGGSEFAIPTCQPVGTARFAIQLIGQVNIYNALAAIAVAKSQNIADETIQKALTAFKGMPGRFEWVETNKNFKVMVDYAPEPESMKKLYETLKLFKFPSIIHVLGSTGGGRDAARRPLLGKLAAQNANYVIVTNEDPYDDDPQEIIDQVADGATSEGKVLNRNLFKILDRREAIQKALSLAQISGLVLITGKGCEQYICVAHGKKIPWDDREVVRELLKNYV